MDKSHRLPLPLTSEDYEAIGALVAHFSNIEFMAGVVIWRILDLPAYNGTLLTTSLSLSQRLDLVIALLKNQGASEDIIGCIKSVQTKFSQENGITARRNRYVHAVWGTDTGGAAGALNFNKQGKPKTSDHDTAASIEAVTLDISIQSRAFMGAVRRLGYDLDSEISFEAPPPSLP